MSAAGQLTVGELRAVIDGLPDDTNVMIEYGPADVGVSAPARMAAVYPSDTVLEEDGGTDPETQGTVAVLAVSTEWVDWRPV